MHSYEYWCVPIQIATHQCGMHFAIQLVLINDHLHLAMCRIDRPTAVPEHMTLISETVANQIGHGDELHLVLLAVLNQFRHTGH